MLIEATERSRHLSGRNCYTTGRLTISLTVSRSVTEIHNLLVCDACTKTIKEPKVLPCSHSFCKACLDKLTTQENVDGEGKTFACPTCMSSVTLKVNENLAGLPDNEFIVNLLTAVGPDRKKDACMCLFPTPGAKRSLGSQYARNVKCFSVTNATRVTKVLHRCKTIQCLFISEIITERQEIGRKILSCTQHKDAIPKFYCETCKELICMKCVASVHTKPGHTCVAIHEIFRKQQKPF